jgi:alpha-L-rhamnosidase
MRFGRTNNGAVTRPAPIPGVGFECDKFDTVAFNAHFAEFVEKLIPANFASKQKKGGLTKLHMDSWEMGAQNWDANFSKEFQHRRGYDPTPFFPVYSGMVVGSIEISERFLWDLRLTSQELIIENYAGHAKKVARRYGLNLSIEPYDMNPTADMDLGAVADIPMCEFWNKGLGFNTSFSAVEASSIAHVLGRPVVASEAFTSDWGREGYTAFPGNMKNQSDWALCAGINRFFFHTFAHKPYGDQNRPGMTMGGYGVHWDRGQTWWTMSSAYHKYISRCSYLLQQGRTVADVLYLTPEGAPPSFETMTPALLTKIEELVNAGAIIVGLPPLKSPSLTNYPECDKTVHLQTGKLKFDKLEDWTKRPEKGVKYYSGIATYSKTFDLRKLNQSRLFLSLGEVNCMARVRINGKDLGVAWTAPWQIDITNAVKQGNNQLEIEVANLWANRLIGDEQFPDDGIKDGKWPDWLLEGKPRTSGRYTFCTFKFYTTNSPLQKSGLIGPVNIIVL